LHYYTILINNYINRQKILTLLKYKFSFEIDYILTRQRVSLNISTNII